MNTSRVLIIIGVLASNFVSYTASSATFTVNSTDDAVDANPGDGACNISTANVCTLRAAVQETNALVGPDVIVLPAGTYTLSIAGRQENLSVTGDLDISDDLSITGASATNTIIDAGRVDRIFDIVDSANVAITEMTIQNGDLEFVGAFGEHGGGIRNQGTLTLNKVMVSGNTAGVDFGFGGGIYNVGTLDLTNVAISDNSAWGTGGLRNVANGVVTLTNVTINNNTALVDSAGMDNGENIIGQSSTAMLTNVTISGNVGGPFTSSHGGFTNGGFRDSATLRNVTISDNSGGGIAAANATLMNTIIANNIAGDCQGGVISLGYNLDSDGTCNLIQPTDLSGTDPLLGPLADNGGLTETHGLLVGSPAIDTGAENCTDADGNPLLTDQRGKPRPVDGNGDGTVACDMGAYEVQPAITLIKIDIKPYEHINNINPSSRGLIPVAVLTSDDFDALLVDPATVQFGPAGAIDTHGRAHVKDIDNDGDMDLLFHFRTRETGISCGDTEATLTGQTWDGTLISGTDSVNTVSCR